MPSSVEQLRAFNLGTLLYAQSIYHFYHLCQIDIYLSIYSTSRFPFLYFLYRGFVIVFRYQFNNVQTLWH